jgi:hypothetical protein
MSSIDIPISICFEARPYTEFDVEDSSIRIVSEAWALRLQLV